MAYPYLILSAATEGSRYVECLDRQREQHGDRFLGLVLPDRGSWGENTKIKPDAVRQAFAITDCVLWVDADCYVDPPEELPPGDWDIAFTYNVHPRHKIKTSAGFILFRHTHSTLLFLHTWDANNRRKDKDHPAMMQTVQQMRNRARFLDMTDWLRGRHAINTYARERGEVRG